MAYVQTFVSFINKRPTGKKTLEDNQRTQTKQQEFRARSKLTNGTKRVLSKFFSDITRYSPPQADAQSPD